MRQTFKKCLVPIVLIFLFPHLINVLACFMMSEKQLSEMPIAVYLGDNTSLTRDIVQNFEDNDVFAVKYYAKTPEEIHQLMEQGKISFGLIIPVDFSEDLKKMKSPKIETIIDGSQLSSASFTKIASSEILLSTKVGAMMRTFQGKYNMSKDEALNTSRPIGIATRLLGNPTRNYVDFLLPGLMLALVQVGLVMNATTVFSQSQRERYFYHMGRYTVLYVIAGFVSMVSVLGVQIVFFQVPIAGNPLEILGLTLAFAFAVTAQSLLIAATLNNKVLAAQAGAVWFLPSSILSGYTWPLISMPVILQNLAALMPLTYFGDTVRDLLLKGQAHFLGRNTVILLCLGIASLGLSAVMNKGRLWIQKRGVLKLEMEN